MIATFCKPMFYWLTVKSVLVYLCSSISGDVVDTFRDRSLDGKMISGKFLYQGLERVWIDLVGDTAEWNREFGFSVYLNIITQLHRSYFTFTIHRYFIFEALYDNLI
jgi:hypothetical protein